MALNCMIGREISAVSSITASRTQLLVATGCDMDVNGDPNIGEDQDHQEDIPD